MTDAAIKKQLRRLSAVPLWDPKTNEARAEYVATLRRYCVDDAHVERAVSAMIETERCENPVAALKACCRATFVSESGPSPCADCEPYGGIFRMVEKNGIEFMDRCECARGKWLRGKDHERRTKSETEPHARHEHPSDADWQRRAAGGF